MKLLHTADLHIGKRVNEFSMLEDQKYILQQMLQIADEQRPDAFLLAGDIYDKSLPSAEAVEVFDEFLTELVARNIQVLIVSGNHDSPERLNYGSRIMGRNGVHIAGTFSGTLKQVLLCDNLGFVNFALLPFVKPANVRPYFPNASIDSYEDAIRTIIQSAGLDERERNIIVAHQFVTSGSQQPERSESELDPIGGLDQVDVSVFAPFDYVALGHLHGPQMIGRETVRYAGSPLKYSFSEARHRKSLTLVELRGKGEVTIDKLPLSAMRDMREIKGPLHQLLQTAAQFSEGRDDYIRAILTDEQEVYDAIGQLRHVYPNVMKIDFENSRSRQLTQGQAVTADNVLRRSPLDLFSEFYFSQNNSEMSEQQRRLLSEIFLQMEGERK